MASEQQTVAPLLDTDTLSFLEERIQKTVALVSRLRQDLASNHRALEDAQTMNTLLTEELEILKSEKSNVRGRLEKLLGHIDQLGAA